MQKGKNRKQEGKGIQEEQPTGEDMEKLKNMDTNRKMRKHRWKLTKKMGSSTVAGRQKNGLHAVEE